MIVCTCCQHKEMVGALFCSVCGAPLSSKQVGTPNLASIPFQPRERPAEAPAPEFPSFAGDADIALNILESGEILPIAGVEEITLGRVNPDQPIIPDVDLTPYHAYEAGVSRLHASLRIRESEILIIDLASANGTRLNGKLIPPHVPSPVEHGDILTLGKFKIQVLIRR